MIYHNACKLGPQTEKEAQALNFKRIDSLAKYKLANVFEKEKLVAWFKQQPEEWQKLRHDLFYARLRNKREY